MTVIANAAGTAGTIGAGVELGDGATVWVGVKAMQPDTHWYDPAHKLLGTPAAVHAALPVVQAVGTDAGVPNCRTGVPVQGEFEVEYTRTP